MIIDCYGVLGTGFAKDLRDQVRKAPAGEPIELHISSPGGIVAEGVTAFNVLRACGREVQAYLDGDAFSAATLLVCAADYAEMPANALMMIHEPWVPAVDGTIAECENTAKYLRATKRQAAQIYQAKTNQPAERWDQLMAEETYFDAQQSLAIGLVDNMTGPSAAIANLKVEAYGARNKSRLANMLASRRLVRDPAELLASIQRTRATCQA